jgi:hypothetical protein
LTSRTGNIRYAIYHNELAGRGAPPPARRRRPAPLKGANWQHFWMSQQK